MTEITVVLFGQGTMIWAKESSNGRFEHLPNINQIFTSPWFLLILAFATIMSGIVLHK
ncbi:hypothetical protein [Robertmurraya korlensis]|uniref:hypothetical protein n=1 Tax=Robertmurraya korlensis TaxID=519977 RepID=UPI000AF6E4F5|nr:hypothetical protein [Robertmurraya korlensis]